MQTTRSTVSRVSEGLGSNYIECERQADPQVVPDNGKELRPAELYSSLPEVVISHNSNSRDEPESSEPDQLADQEFGLASDARPSNDITQAGFKEGSTWTLYLGHDVRSTPAGDQEGATFGFDPSTFRIRTLRPVKVSSRLRAVLVRDYHNGTTDKITMKVEDQCKLVSQLYDTSRLSELESARLIAFNSQGFRADLDYPVRKAYKYINTNPLLSWSKANGWTKPDGVHVSIKDGTSVVPFESMFDVERGTIYRMISIGMGRTDGGIIVTLPDHRFAADDLTDSYRIIYQESLNKGKELLRRFLGRNMETEVQPCQVTASRWLTLTPVRAKLAIVATRLDVES